MSKNFDYTIVYVFGPEQCEEKYFNDEILSREAGEWVKIGETGFRGSIEEVTTDLMKDQSLRRINNESRTGIPVTSKIYDVFIFPYQPKTDDLIRKRLCAELYNLDNSKQINKQLKDDKYIIRAGEEFVYGVCRSNIKFAVQSFDHDLIAKAEDEEQIKAMAKICRCNDIDIDNNTAEPEDVVLVRRKPTLDLDLILESGETIVLTNGVGQEVQDENGESITATYIGGNKFECRGETGRTSGLAKKYLNMYGGKNLITVNGNEYWTYKGQKLTSLRKN
jgi:hypothetical protein